MQKRNKGGRQELFYPQANKRATILVSNIIFIILNLVFLTIVILFILQQGKGITTLEESYAKQIALIFDSAKPGMDIFLNFEEGAAVVRNKMGSQFLQGNLFKQEVVTFDKNVVTVKLDKTNNRKGYSYSFFNDVNFTKVGYFFSGGGIYFVFER